MSAKMPFIQGYDTPFSADICNNFDISAVTAVLLSPKTRIVATSGKSNFTKKKKQI
jgi:hypothetical protein